MNLKEGLKIDHQLEFNNQKVESKRILLIEDNPEDTEMIREMLTEIMDEPFELNCARALSSGLERIAEEGVDLVLLDLFLPNSQGLDTFVYLTAQAPDIPIIVLVRPDEESLAVSATQIGAQDYIIKGQTKSIQLGCAVRYAIEQHKIQVELRNLALIDELTGLYSRHAFLILGQHYLKLAKRTKRGLLLLFVNLTEMKRVNKNLSQKEEQVLIDTANVLKQTFRRSDIIARISGDEFAIIALEAFKDGTKTIVSRLQKNIGECNMDKNKSYKLSLSIGTAYYDPKSPCSIAELVARARKSLYCVK